MNFMTDDSQNMSCRIESEIQRIVYKYPEKRNGALAILLSNKLSISNCFTFKGFVVVVAHPEKRPSSLYIYKY